MIFTLFFLFVVSSFVLGGKCPLSCADAGITGRCVEARTASVFAGACHYGAEATTAGREAVIAWRFDSGSHAGVDLSGVEAAVAVAGDANLAERGTERRSMLYLSDRATCAQRRAAEDLVRTRFGDAVGEIVEVRSVPLSVELDGDQYRVEAGDFLALRGEALPDRACCKMPANVWYRPFVELDRPIVGRNEVFSFADERLAPAWTRRDENTGFVGAFRLDG